MTAAIAVIVTVTWVSGGVDGSAMAGLSEPSPLTRWALPVTRVLTDGSAVATIGFLLAASVLVPGRGGALSPSGRKWMGAAALSAAVWGSCSLLVLLFTAAEVLGTPVTRLLTSAGTAGLSGLPQVRALAAAALVASGLAVWCRRANSVGGAAVGLFVAVLGSLPPGLFGHAAAAKYHDVAMISLGVHVAAATLWIGGLAAVVGQVRIDRGAVPVAASRYSRIALCCFVAVAVSGVINAATHLAGPSQLIFSEYGRLVIGKLLAIGALGWFGATHRRRTLPVLAEAGRIGPFARLAAAEVVIMAAVVALAVGLSRTPTPANPADASAAVAGPTSTAALPVPAQER